MNPIPTIVLTPEREKSVHGSYNPQKNLKYCGGSYIILKHVLKFSF